MILKKYLTETGIRKKPSMQRAFLMEINVTVLDFLVDLDV